MSLQDVVLRRATVGTRPLQAFLAVGTSCPIHVQEAARRKVVLPLVRPATSIEAAVPT